MDLILTATFYFLYFIHCSHSEIIQLSPYTANACPDSQTFQEFRTNITTELVRKLPTNNSSPCRAEDGWRKVIDIDMSDPNDNCPQGLTLYSNPFRLCGRTRSTTYDFCESSTIAVGGQSYTNVCGRLKGYQRGQLFSFYNRNNIEISYLDGVSLTYGPSGSRQHIWSFTVGLNQQTAGLGYCPRPGVDGIPAFITNDYFCDSGVLTGTPTNVNLVYVDLPLWDGVEGGCDGDSNMPTRCYVNNPPWFHKTLPAATTQNIELRICGYSTITYGDTLLQEIELYIK